MNLATREMSRSSSRTGISNDTSRRRPPLAHERGKDSGGIVHDKTEAWKSSVDERKSLVRSRLSPLGDKRYSSEDEEKNSSVNEKKNYFDRRCQYEYSCERTYDERKIKEIDSGDKRTHCNDRKPAYEKRVSCDESLYRKRESCDDKELFSKNDSYDKKSYGSKRETYNDRELSYDQRTSHNKSLYDDTRESFDGKKMYDKRDVYDKKSLYDDKKSLYDDKKLLYDSRDSYNKKFLFEENRSSAQSNRKSYEEKVTEKRNSFSDKRYNDDKDSYYNKSTVENRPVGDWKSNTNDSRSTFGVGKPNTTRKSLTHDRSSDEDWDLSDDCKKLSISRKSPIEDRNYLEDTRKEDQVLSGEDWDSVGHHRSSYSHTTHKDERKSVDSSWRSSSSRKYASKESSPVSHRRSVDNTKSSFDRRKSSDEDRGYPDDCRKSSVDRILSDKERKPTIEVWKPSVIRDSSDKDWDSYTSRRISSDIKKPVSNEWKSSSDRRSYDDDRNTSVSQRLSGKEKITSDYEKKSYLPDISHILDLLVRVKLRNQEEMSSMLYEVVQEVKHCLSHPEYTRVLIMKIYDRCKEDQEFALRAGALCGMIHHFKFGDLSIKAVLLRCIQHDLEEKEHDRGEEYHVLNSIFFLSELYFHMRIKNLPISILGEALLKHLEPLLLDEEAEFELLATCLIVNGSTLLQDQSAKFSKLILKIHTSLVKEALSVRCRCWLLLVIELASRDFAPLPPDICKMFRCTLGSTTFEKFERMRPSIADSSLEQ